MPYAATPSRKPRRDSLKTDGRGSGHGPGVAAADQRRETLGLGAGDPGCGLGDLVAGEVVVRRTGDLAEDPDRRLVQAPGVGEPGDRERGRRVVAVRVV